jgi:hypothetical protein
LEPSDFSLTVPHYVKLRKPESWRPHPAHDHGFQVFRFHYHLAVQPALGRLYCGPPVGDLTVTKGVVRTDIRETTAEAEETDEVASSRELLQENQTAQELAVELSGRLTVPGMVDLNQRWLERLTLGLSTRQTVTARRSITFRTELTVDGGKVDGEVLLASSYRKVTYDVYLVCIDYLNVIYERSGAQLRRRRIKLPPPPQPQDHRQAPNEFPRLNWPIKTFSFWRLIPERSPVKGAGYNVEVGRPFELTVAELNAAVSHPLPTEKVPTLYELSNAAFHPKWDHDLRKLLSSQSS